MNLLLLAINWKELTSGTWRSPYQAARFAKLPVPRLVKMQAQLKTRLGFTHRNAGHAVMKQNAQAEEVGREVTPMGWFARLFKLFA